MDVSLDVDENSKYDYTCENTSKNSKDDKSVSTSRVLFLDNNPHTFQFRIIVAGIKICEFLAVSPSTLLTLALLLFGSSLLPCKLDLVKVICICWLVFLVLLEGTCLDHWRFIICVCICG